MPVQGAAEVFEAVVGQLIGNSLIEPLGVRAKAAEGARSATNTSRPVAKKIDVVFIAWEKGTGFIKLSPVLPLSGGNKLVYELLGLDFFWQVGVADKSNAS